MGKPSTTVVITEYYNHLAQEFYTNRQQLGYSLPNCRTQWHRIKEFLHFAETHIGTEITSLSTENILQFYRLQQERPGKTSGKPLSQKTLWDYIRTIQAFYTLLQNTGKASHNPAATIRIEQPKTESPRIALTQQEVKELYRHTKTLQERAMLSLAYGCGLRVSELVQCNIEDIRLREGILIVPKGKGNKSRTVPMSKTVIKDLSDYLFKERLPQHSKDPKAFIIHIRGGRMKYYTYNKLLKKLVKRTKNKIIQAKQISIHNLRHSIATHLIEQGVPL